MTLLQPSADLRARGVLLNVNGAYRTCHTAAGVMLRRPGFPTRAPQVDWRSTGWEYLPGFSYRCPRTPQHETHPVSS